VGESSKLRVSKRQALLQTLPHKSAYNCARYQPSLDKMMLETMSWRVNMTTVSEATHDNILGGAQRKRTASAPVDVHASKILSILR
jgi:hypothetical protein